MTDKAAIPDAWSPFGKPRGTRDPELNIDARAQAFLDRIAPLLSRSCRPRRHPRSGLEETPPYLPSRGPQTQRATHPGYRQTLSLQVPRRYPPNRPRPPRPAPQKDALRPALFLPRPASGGNPRAQRGLPPARPRGPIQPDPAGPARLHRKSPRPPGQRPLPRKRDGPDGSHRAPAGLNLL